MLFDVDDVSDRAFLAVSVCLDDVTMSFVLFVLFSNDAAFTIGAFVRVILFLQQVFEIG